MRRDPRWPQILIGASIVPMLMLSAYIIWFASVFRRSGRENWDDAVSIFNLGVLAYPISLLLLVAGCSGMFLLRSHDLHPFPLLSRVLFVFSIIGLAMPWFVLIVAMT